MAIADRAFESGQMEAARRAAGTTVRPEHGLDRAIAQSSMEGLVVRGIMSANKAALTQPVEHPIFAEGRAFVRKINAGGTVQVKDAPRFPSGFRKFGQ